LKYSFSDNGFGKAAGRWGGPFYGHPRPMGIPGVRCGKTGMKLKPHYLTDLNLKTDRCKGAGHEKWFILQMILSILTLENGLYCVFWGQKGRYTFSNRLQTVHLYPPPQPSPAGGECIRKTQFETVCSII
jgi:hypothetical protein